MSFAGIVAYRWDRSVCAPGSGVPTPAAEVRGRPGSRPAGPRSRGGLHRRVLLLLLLLLCAGVTAAKPHINCRVHVFHPRCRGVAARFHSGGRALSPLKGARLRTLLHNYITADNRLTSAMESLGEYLNEEKPALPEQRRNDDSLLRRLLRAVRDSEESVTLPD